MQKLTTNLWFGGNAEEAAQFYTKVFKGTIGRKSYFGSEGQEIHGMPKDMVAVIEFEIMDRQFTGLNGGPAFTFNKAISFIINCENQEEVDYYWNTLKEAGDESAQQCGWLKDKYGLSWQVIPIQLVNYMTQGSREQAERVMAAMLKMKKIIVSDLDKAFNGELLTNN